MVQGCYRVRVAKGPHRSAKWTGDRSRIRRITFQSGTYVYAHSSSRLVRLFASSDGGANWDELPVPPIPEELRRRK